jgi:hypothetical protein
MLPPYNFIVMLFHHRDTEGTEERVFAHSREIPRMGKVLVRLQRSFVIEADTPPSFAPPWRDK